MDMPKMQPNRSQLVNALRDTAQSASNMVAENLSVPIDAIAWALRKAGVPVNKPMFGSDWMNEQGVTPKVEQSGAKVIGDTIGMLSPLGFTKQGAKALIDAGSAVKNMPVGMSIKDVSGAYPQAEALALAQQRAALPVSQGGLGLGPNNTAMERAVAMGFDTPAYHGTTVPFEKFNTNTRGTYFTSPDAGFANKYTVDSTGQIVDDANVIPMLVNPENAFDYQNKLDVKNLSQRASLGALAESQIKKGDWRRLEDRTTLEAIRKIGKGGVYVNEDGIKNLAVFSPDQMRSRFAAFDPFRKTAATAAALGVAAPDLLAKEQDK